MPRIISVCLVLLSVSLSTQAEIAPMSHPSDRHVQVAYYDPNQVYRISAMQGYITAIQFGEGEEVISVNIGDSAAWLVNVQNDIINLKPIVDHPDTNMNVLTSRGTYQFFLTAPAAVKREAGLSKPLPNTTFILRFRYNDGFKPRTGDQSATKSWGGEKLRENWNYTARGDSLVAPLCVYDNGRFTFFDFTGRQAIPAIFSVDSRGRESLINYHVQGKYVVVETTAKQFTLRSGETVASIFQEGRS